MLVAVALWPRAEAAAPGGCVAVAVMEISRVTAAEAANRAVAIIIIHVITPRPVGGGYTEHAQVNTATGSHKT
jgi:hypothetical protein